MRMEQGRTPFVRGNILIEFRRLADALAIDADALFRRVGIERGCLEDPETALPMRAVAELLELAATTSGIDDLGQRLGEARGLPDLGPLILMLREEETVRGALLTLTSLLYLHSDALYMRLDDDEVPVLVIDLIAGGTDHWRQAMESTVASTTTILRWLLGETWTPESVSFTHSRPASVLRHERFFKCPVDFLQSFNGLVLERAHLDRRLPASSPILKRQIQRLIQSINVAPDETYLRRVTQVVAMALPRGEAKAELVASYLGVERRTLHRRLKRAATNFSGVLETVRRDLASQYILGSDRPLSDIANLIGFDSLSTFSRWFSKSHGVAPARWRNQQRAAQFARGSTASATHLAL